MGWLTSGRPRKSLEPESLHGLNPFLNQGKHNDLDTDRRPVYIIWKQNHLYPNSFARWQCTMYLNPKVLKLWCSIIYHHLGLSSKGKKSPKLETCLVFLILSSIWLLKRTTTEPLIRFVTKLGGERVINVNQLYTAK